MEPAGWVAVDVDIELKPELGLGMAGEEVGITAGELAGSGELFPSSLHVWIVSEYTVRIKEIYVV